MKRYREEIEPKLVEFKDHNITIVCEKYVEALGLRYFDKEGAINNIYLVNELLEGKLDDMQFDYIVGNPPYQMSKIKGQNKLYTKISMKCIELLSNNGQINFITPKSIAKAIKGFSLIGLDGLKEIDFSVNEDFHEGVEIISWIFDKTYSTKSHGVKVIHADLSEEIIAFNELIYDKSLKKNKLFDIYLGVYDFSSKRSNISNRMFCYNATSKISKNKTDEYNFELYKNENEIYGFLSKAPKFFQKLKFMASMTKSNDENVFIISNKDFFQNYVFCEVKQEEIKNIKSFILSDYFSKLSNFWKKIDGYGFNNALKYCPKFDKSKSWTNEEVQSFFENREWLE